MLLNIPCDLAEENDFRDDSLRQQCRIIAMNLELKEDPSARNAVQ